MTMKKAALLAIFLMLGVLQIRAQEPTLDQSREAQIERLQALQIAMNAAMETKNHQEALEIAGEIHKLSDQITKRLFDESHNINIVKALYGSYNTEKDVTSLLTAQVKNNKIHLTVNNLSMGCDPDKGNKKRLLLVFEINGQIFKNLTLESEDLIIHDQKKQKADYENFELESTSQGLVIKKYIGKSIKVIVPEKIDGKKVFAIGEGAFGEKSDVYEVSLPNTIEEIKRWAFLRCRNLEKINLPKGLKTIGQGAFRGCRRMGPIKIPEGVKIIEQETFHFTGYFNPDCKIHIPKFAEVTENSFIGVKAKVIRY